MGSLRWPRPSRRPYPPRQNRSAYLWRKYKSTSQQPTPLKQNASASHVPLTSAPFVRYALLPLIKKNPDDSFISTLNNPSQASTFFVDPTGAPHPSFTINDDYTGESKAMETSQCEEEILYADMDLEECVEGGKQHHDGACAYQQLRHF
ncbi:hypothetical protein N7G274_007979 [Stereocaulon virgatum]|uniref:Uncharacterized protein n=1 Tax=Stereocaulon virgatum TaxID=373712 RepID=A0ABR4A207_9LECA